jgi:hypothetical protein
MWLCSTDKKHQVLGSHQSLEYLVPNCNRKIRTGQISAPKSLRHYSSDNGMGLGKDLELYLWSKKLSC